MEVIFWYLRTALNESCSREYGGGRGWHWRPHPVRGRHQVNTGLWLVNALNNGFWLDSLDEKQTEYWSLYTAENREKFFWLFLNSFVDKWQQKVSLPWVHENCRGSLLSLLKNKITELSLRWPQPCLAVIVVVELEYFHQMLLIVWFIG